MPAKASTTNAAKTKTLERSRERIVRAHATREVGEQVQGPHDEDTAVKARQLARAEPCGSRLGDRLDLPEMRARALREVGGGQRARARRRGRDERRADLRERAEHPVDVLVGEDRGDDDVGATGELPEQVQDAAEVVRAVPDLVRARAAALEAAGQPDALRGGAVERASDELLRRRPRERQR